MLFQKIKNKYKDEWVLIQVTKAKKETYEIEEGKVLFHSANKDLVNEYIFNHKPNNCAIRFAGEVPKEWALVL